MERAAAGWDTGAMRLTRTFAAVVITVAASALAVGLSGCAASPAEAPTTPIGGDIVAPVTMSADDLQGGSVDLVVGQVAPVRFGQRQPLLPTQPDRPRHPALKRHAVVGRMSSPSRPGAPHGLVVLDQRHRILADDLEAVRQVPGDQLGRKDLDQAKAKEQQQQQQAQQASSAKPADTPTSTASSVTRNVPLLMLLGFIGSLKLVLMAALIATLLAPSAGKGTLTVGSVLSAPSPVVKVQLIGLSRALPASTSSSL